MLFSAPLLPQISKIFTIFFSLFTCKMVNMTLISKGFQKSSGRGATELQT